MHFHFLLEANKTNVCFVKLVHPSLPHLLKILLLINRILELKKHEQKKWILAPNLLDMTEIWHTEFIKTKIRHLLCQTNFNIHMLIEKPSKPKKNNKLWCIKPFVVFRNSFAEKSWKQVLRCPRYVRSFIDGAVNRMDIEV